MTAAYRPSSCSWVVPSAGQIRFTCTRPISEPVDGTAIAEGYRHPLLLVDEVLDLPLNAEDCALRARRPASLGWRGKPPPNTMPAASGRTATCSQSAWRAISRTAVLPAPGPPASTTRLGGCCSRTQAQGRDPTVSKAMSHPLVLAAGWRLTVSRPPTRRRNLRMSFEHSTTLTGTSPMSMLRAQSSNEIVPI